MSAAVSTAERPEPESSALLRTLVLCDLVNSTALVENLGDREAAELIRKHDRLARTIADRHGGREIDKTDGFLMMFERPIQAVGFALDYQRGLRQLNAAEGLTLSARVGIHVGDVVVWENNREDIARGAKQVEVEGLVKPIASRLMSLALPGQILLSNIAYDLAHRAQGELGIKLDKVRWRTHGRYRFRGIPDPVAVFEVGEDGLAPLKPPPWSSKAHREVPFWRRPATVVIESLVVAILIAIPIYMFAKPEPAIAFANRDWVVVGSFNNLTGETVFDDALETALRIGLEQSRYVNVLPDLKVRDTLKRMDRDPDKTKVDRNTGSEVAIRDGARALILPTIAEIDGRVRITAEVIDPQTQTTVYSESADGIGAESVLPSLDTINGRLRVRLGEALATVSKESLPLEKVATSNLDALRVYSRGINAEVIGDETLATALYEKAISLDAGFSLARISLAGILMRNGFREEAKSQLHAAVSAGERVALRERMEAEAMLANFESAKKSLQKWKVFSEVYPDLFVAQGSYAYYAWSQANDYDGAIEAALRSAARQNPHRGRSHYLLGALYLGNEQYAKSLEQFKEADALELHLENQLYASLFAAQRQFPRMLEVLASGRSPDQPHSKLDEYVMRLAVMLDQGHWSEAQHLSDEVRAGNDASTVNYAVIESVDLSRRILVSSSDKRKQIVDAYLNTRVEKRFDSRRADPGSWYGRILFNAWIAARSGSLSAARKNLELARKFAVDGGYPALTAAVSVVEAELLLRDGNAQQAVNRLAPPLSAQAPYAARIVLMEAYAELGDYEAARNEARWLGAHRGRAYTESWAGETWIPYNVAYSTISQLAVAEFSIRLGERDVARAAMKSFTTAWPDYQKFPELQERVSAVDTAISSSPSLPQK